MNPCKIASSKLFTYSIQPNKYCHIKSFEKGKIQMTDKKRHARGYYEENDFREKRSSRYSFKQYMENIRLQEAFDNDDEDDTHIESEEEC